MGVIADVIERKPVQDQLRASDEWQPFRLDTRTRIAVSMML